MKTIAYTALHYGIEYLAYAIRSVIQHVDEYHVLYTAKGSHSHRTAQPCPDSRDALHRIALLEAGNKLIWHEGNWIHEGDQRDSIFALAPDASIVLVLDSDEIWGDGLAEYAVNYARDALENETAVKRYRLPIIHYWRSFRRCVLHDPAFPERIILPQARDGENTLRYQHEGHEIKINHLGYAQRPQIIEYKLLTHGHRNEFRHDVDWFYGVFMTNRQTDCHPVGSDYWNPEDINPLDYMPGFMRSHPYFDLDVIGEVKELA